MLLNMVCRLCGEPAAAIMEGCCVAYPDDKQQIVCAQHFINDGFLEGVKELWVAEWVRKMGY